MNQKLFQIQNKNSIIKIMIQNWKCITLQLINYKTGNEYICQIRFINMWLFPHINKHWYHDQFTLFGWLFLYFGKSNAYMISTMMHIAETINENLKTGLEQMLYYVSDKQPIQKLIIQYDNLIKHTHPKPDWFYNDLATILNRYQYDVTNDGKIKTYNGIPVIN